MRNFLQNAYSTVKDLQERLDQSFDEAIRSDLSNQSLKTNTSNSSSSIQKDLIGEDKSDLSSATICSLLPRSNLSTSATPQHLATLGSSQLPGCPGGVLSSSDRPPGPLHPQVDGSLCVDHTNIPSDICTPVGNSNCSLPNKPFERSMIGGETLPNGWKVSNASTEKNNICATHSPAEQVLHVHSTSMNQSSASDPTPEPIFTPGADQLRDAQAYCSDTRLPATITGRSIRSRGGLGAKHVLRPNEDPVVSDVLLSSSTQFVEEPEEENGKIDNSFGKSKKGGLDPLPYVTVSSDIADLGRSNRLEPIHQVSRPLINSFEQGSTGGEGTNRRNAGREDEELLDVTDLVSSKEDIANTAFSYSSNTPITLTSSLVASDEDPANGKMNVHKETENPTSSSKQLQTGDLGNCLTVQYQSALSSLLAPLIEDPYSLTMSDPKQADQRQLEVELRSSNQLLQAAVNRLAKENCAIKMELETTKDDLEGYKNEGMQLSKRLGLFEERTRLLKADLQATEDQLVETSSRETVLKEEVQRLKDELTKMPSVEKKLEDFDVEVQKLKNVIEEKTALNIALANELTELKLTAKSSVPVDKFDSELSDLRRKNDELMQINRLYQQRLEETEHQLEVIEVERQNAVDNARKEHDQLTQELTDIKAQAGLVIAPLSRRIFELENRLREAEELVRRQKVLNRKTEEVPVTQNVENLCEKYRDDIKQAGELSFQLEMKLNKVLKELEEKKAEAERVKAWLMRAKTKEGDLCSQLREARSKIAQLQDVNEMLRVGLYSKKEKDEHHTSSSQHEQQCLPQQRSNSPSTPSSEHDLATELQSSGKNKLAASFEEVSAPR